jgi:hypothetical protein
MPKICYVIFGISMFLFFGQVLIYKNYFVIKHSICTVFTQSRFGFDNDEYGYPFLNQMYDLAKVFKVANQLYKDNG